MDIDIYSVRLANFANGHHREKELLPRGND